MEYKRILFTRPETAELTTGSFPDEPGPEKVLVRTAYSTVSPGTERAAITDSPNCGGFRDHVFPRSLGYSSTGTVVRVGEGVDDLKEGDRVLVYWGKHNAYNLVDRSQVVRIEYDEIDPRQAALIFISTFPLAAIRKCRLEIGEKALVMGCGLLGQLAVKLLCAAGAAPVVAADPVEARREEALRHGADLALDPTLPDFKETVRARTCGGVNVGIEVTGVGAGLDETLDAMAQFGRIALLGCTRRSDFTIDYYRKVHCRGITMIGAHTCARPKEESYPGYFTHRDDIMAVQRLMHAGRLDFGDMLSAAPFSPEDCQSVYDHVINDRAFPTVAQFDWRDKKYV